MWSLVPKMNQLYLIKNASDKIWANTFTEVDQVNYELEIRNYKINLLTQTIAKIEAEMNKKNRSNNFK